MTEPVPQSPVKAVDSYFSSSGQFVGFYVCGYCGRRFKSTATEIDPPVWCQTCGSGDSRRAGVKYAMPAGRRKPKHKHAGEAEQ